MIDPLGVVRALVAAAPDDEDAWGFSPSFARAAQPHLDVLYDRWWRVEASGLEHVPATGRALLVANHAGVLPWDAAMMATAIRRGPHPRDPRFLVLDRAFELPWVSTAIRRFGGVPASPYNAQRLLEEDHAVMVFPEGAKGTGKAWSERYRVGRLGRGGFVATALRARAPVVPCAVVGSEEIYPKVGELPVVARLLGAPYFPVTPTFPLLGPLGFVPLPSRWRLAFGEPVDLRRHGPEDADDPAVVLRLAEEIRARVQQMVYDEVVRRGGAFS